MGPPHQPLCYRPLRRRIPIYAKVREGANRLAANSLLEGVVFGRHAAEAQQTLAWDGCGIARNAKGLAEVLDRIDHGGREAITEPTRADYEKRNIATVLRLIAKAALIREESRGGHYREDFPQKSPKPCIPHSAAGIPRS